MSKFKKSYLINYGLNKKNTTRGSKQTSLDPGYPPEIAIDIKSIEVEEKTALLKTLKVGQFIEFKIDQDLSLEEDRSYYASGNASGFIKSFDLDAQCDCNEYQCVEIELLEGYNEFYRFPTSELSLIESLRTLRIMNYSAWLARRWDDPAFPRNFPWFNSVRYWSEHILQLREQLSALDEPPLEILV